MKEYTAEEFIEELHAAFKFRYYNFLPYLVNLPNQEDIYTLNFFDEDETVVIPVTMGFPLTEDALNSSISICVAMVDMYVSLKIHSKDVN